jgi:hypothetical protein
MDLVPNEVTEPASKSNRDGHGPRKRGKSEEVGILRTTIDAYKAQLNLCGIDFVAVRKMGKCVRRRALDEGFAIFEPFSALTAVKGPDNLFASTRQNERSIVCLREAEPSEVRSDASLEQRLRRERSHYVAFLDRLDFGAFFLRLDFCHLPHVPRPGV